MLERTDYSSVESSEEPYAYRGRRPSHLPPAPPPPAQSGPGPYRGPSDVSETTSSFGTHDPYVVMDEQLTSINTGNNHKHLKNEVNKVTHAQRVGRRTASNNHNDSKGNIYESVAYAERQRKLHQPKGVGIFSRHQMVTTMAGSASCGSTSSSSEEFSSSSPGHARGTSATMVAKTPPNASSGRARQSSSGDAHRRRHNRGEDEVVVHAQHRRKYDHQHDFLEVLDGYDLDYDHQYHHRQHQLPPSETYYNSPFSW